jgi:hypothetical protein
MRLVPLDIIRAGRFQGSEAQEHSSWRGLGELTQGGFVGNENISYRWSRFYWLPHCR